MDTEKYVASAWFKGQKIAETDQAIKLEGNYYFPADALSTGVLTESPTTYVCPWKGKANYRHLVIDGETLNDAVWTYLDPSNAASHISKMIAFDKSKGIQVKSETPETKAGFFGKLFK